MFILKFFPVIVLCSVICFCDGCNDLWTGPPPQIYKLKGDYINKVCVGLTEDKSRIRAYPDMKDNCGDPDNYPLKVDSGYYLDDCCNYGVTSAYLSLSKEDYKEYIPRDSMYKMIIDKDPYEEYYVDENRILIKSGTECCVLDTALLNEIIKNKKLEEYFKRLI